MSYQWPTCAWYIRPYRGWMQASNLSARVAPKLAQSFSVDSSSSRLNFVVHPKKDIDKNGERDGISRVYVAT